MSDDMQGNPSPLKPGEIEVQTTVAPPVSSDDEMKTIEVKLKKGQELELKRKEEERLKQGLTPEEAKVTEFERFVSDVERDLLFQIIVHMKHREMTGEEAQKVAKEFLTLLPVVDKEDLLKKLGILSQAHKGAREVFLKYAAPSEEEQRLIKIQTMSEHIKNGDIEKAITVAKGGTYGS